MNIRQGNPADAGLIGECVVSAIGEEIAGTLASPAHTVQDVVEMFAALAAMPDTQYSYLNTLVIENEEGTPCGVAVAYDGAGLHEMRKHFFDAARTCLGKDMEAMEDECTPDEFYLDTVAVLPGHRGKGYAKSLIKATAERAAVCGKPLGLLVEKENTGARKLYDSLGFVQVGETPFAFVLMDHMQIPQ